MSLKPKEIRDMSEDKIKERVKEIRLELSREMANIEVGASVKSPGLIKDMRKDIAKLKTILNEKTRGVEK